MTRDSATWLNAQIRGIEKKQAMEAMSDPHGIKGIDYETVDDEPIAPVEDAIDSLVDAMHHVDGDTPDAVSAKDDKLKSKTIIVEAEAPGAWKAADTRNIEDLQIIRRHTHKKKTTRPMLPKEDNEQFTDEEQRG